ncbi:small subunit ribosomal protein S5 [Chaetoceros tenuissimus]|uniref:Small subunit ribosomal protein S5 n=1 Tax=Chaetoceros tenuissimus TaxID=426638 RepID=A0AAD3DBR3_9STRA|nr:small subunit ribosomal protein S5 [Chaetoceros tenuissimus]
MLSKLFNEKLVISRSHQILRTLSSKEFRPSSLTPKPLKQSLLPKSKKISKKAKPIIPLSDKFDPTTQDTFNYLSSNGNTAENHESTLRIADYLTSAPGSTEDLVGRRRAFMNSKEQQAVLEQQLQELLEEASRDTWNDVTWNQEHEGFPNPKEEGYSNITANQEDKMQKAFGDWSETIVRVDRVQKVQRGGTMVRYRALVIGGNLNGCAGFGVAKANAPNEAAAAAARIAKRNIFFIDRYNGSGLTSSLAGRHNSCKVTLRSVNPNRGLSGHPLVNEILKYFGISDCAAKSHGNRNVYNVVRATFKAIMTHESLEDIALKRGKRLMNLERAKRLKI